MGTRPCLLMQCLPTIPGIRSCVSTCVRLPRSGRGRSSARCSPTSWPPGCRARFSHPTWLSSSGGRPTLTAPPTPTFWSTTRITRDRKSTRLNSSHLGISYAVFCLKIFHHCRPAGFGGRCPLVLRPRHLHLHEPRHRLHAHALAAHRRRRALGPGGE